jgi:hypothetical protein
MNPSTILYMIVFAAFLAVAARYVFGALDGPEDRDE